MKVVLFAVPHLWSLVTRRAVVGLSLLSGCVVSTGPESTLEQAEIPDGGVHCRNEVRLNLSGVTCPSCSEVVAASLKAVPGVISAQVTLSPAQADVIYCDSVSLDSLTNAVDSAGYHASIAN